MRGIIIFVVWPGETIEQDLKELRDKPLEESGCIRRGLQKNL